MTIQRTFSIIKPDAVKRNLEGKILSFLQEAKFNIVALKKMQFSKELAEKFYEVHKERPFYNDLCAFMSSGPVVSSVLEKENAILDYRTIMGATNPKDANCGTIRNLYAISIDENSVHGSDSEENARIEMNLIFAQSEILP
ncbi:nucleoside-diphosphate kinase [Alphaproteobacteria bacterium endosymbiont of Tiliacea citrago]|uniref:nucleoside-diphosphate kinase n=1 Tax=Alphaproteobacteria bacterium endosymbiont of Tiliacea citrago TaxID=3077944 RepID=UPI00313B4292